ncbi:UNVERIFIED_CONTAM: hypothetical protein Slati_2519100 [Sesamum latifolium]|uniref:Reverse transcriptase domain-containing protein n=1 Tax=Sesamum latifolium TaxID=2727402 RepID=A0AAW2WGN1_9LAMI
MLGAESDRAMNLELLRPFTVEEVKHALDSMHPLKSPDLTVCLLFSISVAGLYSPELVYDFRPISLCNVVYKLASKEIANSMKPFLDTLISQSQSAFIPSRSILDNVLVAYEVNHYLSHKYQDNSGHIALKLDLNKAYDRVEWHFLERVMKRLGFDSHFVGLIMLCVKSVSFSFMLNGVSFGHLQPYLFLFCVEAFCDMVRREEAVGSIHEVCVCRSSPRVSHLLFADNTLLFCDANQATLQSVCGLLTKFEEGSGVQVNYQKSAVVLSKNVRHHTQEELAAFIGVVRITKNEKYLGLPSIIGRSKREVFAGLKEKVWRRLQVWTSKRLSQAGRGVLIQSVILDQECNRKIHCVAWSTLCKSKKDDGLGFKRFPYQNMALLSKQGWRLVSNPQVLAYQILRARYFPNSDFSSAQIGSNPSVM